MHGGDIVIISIVIHKARTCSSPDPFKSEENMSSEQEAVEMDIRRAEMDGMGYYVQA